VKPIAAQFPVRDDIQADESGHGYVLRMATDNLLNGLSAVKQMLGKSRFTVLDAADAGTLGLWFGADPAQLGRALGRTAIGCESAGALFEFGGECLTRSYFINRGQPRVCGECLSREGRCRLGWELSVTTACCRHGIFLRSACAACGSPLRWDRPHIAQCRCGWTLAVGDVKPAAAEHIEVAAWVERALGTPMARPPTTAIGRLLDPLSLDAGLHTLWGLASLKPRPADGPKRIPSELRKRNSLASAVTAIDNAASALSQLHAGVQTRWNVPLSTIELLYEACASSYGAADRQVALSLLTRLSHKGVKQTWQSKYPQMSQLALF
jgi:hypothetical protein